MKLTHMARKVQSTPGTNVATQGASAAGLNPDSATDAPSYPGCLTLTLDAETLAMLGVDGAPQAGKQFHLEAFGSVTHSATMDPDVDGDIDHVMLCLQITHMALEHEGPDDTGSAAARLYGPKGA